MVLPQGVLFRGGQENTMRKKLLSPICLRVLLH